MKRKLSEMDWSLINPLARKTPEQKEQERQEKEEIKKEASPLARKYINYVVILTLLLAAVGGGVVLFIFRNQSAQVLFAIAAGIVLVATIVFGVALYVSLGFLQQTALAVKQKQQEKTLDKKSME